MPERKTHMSNNTEVPLIARSHSTACYKPAVLCIFMLSLVFSAGCSLNRHAVNLYVDAAMLRENGENEKAVEKLNSAVAVNKHFSLAYSMLGEIYQEMKDYEKSADSYEKAA